MSSNSSTASTGATLSRRRSDRGMRSTPYHISSARTVACDQTHAPRIGTASLFRSRSITSTSSPPFAHVRHVQVPHVCGGPFPVVRWRARPTDLVRARACALVPSARGADRRGAGSDRSALQRRGAVERLPGGRRRRNSAASWEEATADAIREATLRFGTFGAPSRRAGFASATMTSSSTARDSTVLPVRQRRCLNATDRSSSVGSRHRQHRSQTNAIREAGTAVRDTRGANVSLRYGQRRRPQQE